jgi:hypothetical protein
MLVTNTFSFYNIWDFCHIDINSRDCDFYSNKTFRFIGFSYLVIRRAFINIQPFVCLWCNHDILGSQKRSLPWLGAIPIDTLETAALAVASWRTCLGSARLVTGKVALEQLPVPRGRAEVVRAR